MISAPLFALCVGDCDGSGDVSIDELIRGVNIALGVSPLTDCRSLDRNSDSQVTVDELLAAVNAALTGCPVEPIFPADYRSTYTEVRNCRFSSEHGGVNIRVLADPVAALPYLTNQNPLPTGSVVVKEEYNGNGCQTANLIRWRAMRKEAPGFDPADGDWHWQWVNADRSVHFNDKESCISCHLRPACLSRDHMCTVDPFKQVLSGQPASLLSVSGTSATDVYVVGADPAVDDLGPYVLHYNGENWRRLNTGVTGDLWWISVTPIDGAFYMAGAGGLILRYDPTTGVFTRQVTPGQQSLFGIWGTSATNLYAVGGDPANVDTGGVLWHYDGAAWSDVDLSAAYPDGTPTLFKVWGRSAHEVYVVSQGGSALRFDGTSWRQLQIVTNSEHPLFTVHGNDTVVVATGGFSDGVILELQGDSLVDQATPGTPQMNGVFVPPSGRAVAVGIAGSVAIRDVNIWDLAETGLSTIRDFHATWIDPENGVWAVGGDLSVNLTQGMVAYQGYRTPSSQVVPLPVCPPPNPNPNAMTTVSYSNDIVPIFAARGCQSPACHGGAFPSSGYDMRSYETTFGPGVVASPQKLCEIVPANPDASFLMEKLGPSPRFGVTMPQGRPPLPDEEIALIRTWILEGAYSDAPPTSTPTITPTRGATTPTPPRTPNSNCQSPGVICTAAGTGNALFDGDGKLAPQTSLYYPMAVTFDAQDLPVIDDWNNLRIRRISQDGTVQTIMGKAYEAYPTPGALASDTPLHHASDIAFDNQGRLYVAGDHAPGVFRVGTDNRVSILAGTTMVGSTGDGQPAVQATLTTPFGVLPDEVGGFYIADIDAHVIRYVDPAGIINRVAGTGVEGYSGDGGPATAAQLAGPARMRLDQSGNLYWCEVKNHIIRRRGLDGKIATVAGTGKRGYGGDGGPATQARFDSPYDLRFAPNGDLYVADTGNSVIRRIDSSGRVTTAVGTARDGFAGDGGAARTCQLNRASGINFDTDGTLWISDTFNNRVRRVYQFLSVQN